MPTAWPAAAKHRTVADQQPIEIEDRLDHRPRSPRDRKPFAQSAERPGEGRPLGEPRGDPFSARQPVGGHRGSHTNDQEGRDGEAHEDRRGDDPTHRQHQDRERGDGDDDRRVDDPFHDHRPEDRRPGDARPVTEDVAAHQLAEACRQDVVREIADEQRRGRRSQRDIGDGLQQQPPADRPQGDVERDEHQEQRDPPRIGVPERGGGRLEVDGADDQRERDDRDDDTADHADRPAPGATRERSEEVQEPTLARRASLRLRRIPVRCSR